MFVDIIMTHTDWPVKTQTNTKLCISLTPPSLPLFSGPLSFVPRCESPDKRIQHEGILHLFYGNHLDHTFLSENLLHGVLIRIEN